MLNPFLFTLDTQDCITIYDSDIIVKFVDDTILLGLITNDKETSYKEKVWGLVAWCSANKLLLNMSRTKQMVMDWRRKKVDSAPLQICLERVPSFRFLGEHVEDELRWHANKAAQQVVRKVQQKLDFLRLLNKCYLEVILRQIFYHFRVESMLAYSITLWYAGCMPYDRKALAEGHEDNTEDHWLSSALPEWQCGFKGVKHGKEDPGCSIPPWQEPLQHSVLWQEIQHPDEPHKLTQRHVYRLLNNNLHSTL